MLTYKGSLPSRWMRRACCRRTRLFHAPRESDVLALSSKVAVGWSCCVRPCCVTAWQNFVLRRTVAYLVVISPIDGQHKGVSNIHGSQFVELSSWLIVISHDRTIFTPSHHVKCPSVIHASRAVAHLPDCGSIQKLPYHNLSVTEQSIHLREARDSFDLFFFSPIYQ